MLPVVNECIAYFCLNKSLSDLVMSVKFGMNFPYWFTIPRNRQVSVMFVGVGKLKTPTSVSGSVLSVIQQQMSKKSENIHKSISIERVPEKFL